MRARQGAAWLAALAVAIMLLAACGGDSVPDAANRPAVGSPSATDQSAQVKQDQPLQADAPQGQPAGAALRAEPIDAGYAMEMLRAIAEGVGPRSNGQPGERAMIEFMAEALRGDGYAVAIEPFDFVSLDERHTININVVSEDGDAGLVLAVSAALLMEGSSDVLPVGPIVVVPGVGTADEFATVDAAGAIAVVAGGELTYSEKQRNAETAGAVALIVVDLRPPVIGGSNGPGEIPVLVAPGPDSQLLHENEGATATISEPATEGVPLKSWNVVARRAGGVCRVVVGGHYDTVRGVQGANDNASGIAVLLALARSWAGAASAADVCFVGFGAEELGLHGSQAFVAAARESGALAEITAMLNLDAFGNGERPITGIGSRELIDLLERLGGQLRIEVQAGQGRQDGGSDHAPFYQAGVPALFPRPQGGIMHVLADNLDNIDETLVRDVGLLAQAMLECLLERAGSPIEPRLSCDAESP